MSQTEQPTLLFIPDISGFTEFVNETEIDHSRHIIEELLETIIDADEIGLKVSEIEGDAVLFYREGPAPTAAELLAQVQRMYVRFHGLLRRYETHRICQCGACNRASGLQLKFVAHYGDVRKNKIKDQFKLFGRDVIIAHRLLKNAIDGDEYVLLTHELIDMCAAWVELKQVAWAPPEEGSESYDAGSISYCHIPLDPLQVHVPQPTVSDYGYSMHRRKHLSHEAAIEAPLDMVFDVISDLSSRHVWTAGLQGVDGVNHKVAQRGARHRCIINDDAKDPVLVSHSFDAGSDFVTFIDTEEQQGFSTVFVLRRLGPGLTRMEKHLMLKDGLIFRLLFRLFFQKVYVLSTEQSFTRLNEYCKTLVKEGRQHSSRVVLSTAHVNTQPQGAEVSAKLD